jgi:hypothetical protein
MRGLLAWLFFAIASPAFADTTAVYASPAGSFKLTIEIAANGDVRSDIAGKPGMYLLILTGKGFIITSTSEGPVVDRVEDVKPALEVFFEKRGPPDFKARTKRMESSADTAMPLTLVKGDDVIVQGRKGTPYYTALRGPGAPDHISGKPPPNVSPPVIVVSNDPELAPLGIAMARQFQLTNSMAPWSFAGPLIQRIDDLLKTGAPLDIYDGELIAISHAPIPPSRFDLPAAPESREDLIKRLDATATDHPVTPF